MWRYYQTMNVPDTLRTRLETFAQNGRLQKRSELFGEGSWVQVLLGQGLFPEHYDVNVDMLPAYKIENYLNAIREHVRGIVRKMPRAAEYLTSFCPFQ